MPESKLMMEIVARQLWYVVLPKSKQQLGCRFDIMDNISYFLCFDICNHVCLDTSDHFPVLPS